MKKRVLLIAGTGTLGASAYPELVARRDRVAKMNAYFTSNVETA